MKILKKITNIFLLISAVLALGACGNDMESLTANGVSYETSETLGEGSYSVKAADLVSVSSIEELTDEELIENHIKMLETILSSLESKDEISLPKDVQVTEEMAEKLKAQRAKLIEDLKARLERLKNDEDYRAEVAQKIRKILEEAKKRMESGEGPKIKGDGPVNCEILEKVLANENLPEVIREKEQERFDRNCK